MTRLPATAALPATALAIIVLLGGCANLNSISREITVSEGAKASAIDAKQRVVLSARRTMPGGANATSDLPDLVVCAEPSPDALSAISASFSGSQTGSNSEAVQLALALTEQASSIGLRTQSIQLMRDTMYRACEAYMAGALSRGDFFYLQRRFQNLTLGLLAIEQLTGAVRAGQSALSTAATAGTGESAEAETTALTTARGRLDAAERRVKDERTKQEGFDKELGIKEKDALDARDSFNKLKPEEQTEEKKKVVEGKEALVPPLRQRQADQKRAIESAEAEAATAKKGVDDAETNLALARGRVRAYSSGLASSGPGGSQHAQVTKEVAAAVEGIVKRVLDSTVTESCVGVLDDWRAHPASTKYTTSPGLDLLLACTTKAAAEAAEKAQAAGLPPANVQILLSPK